MLQVDINGILFGVNAIANLVCICKTWGAGNSKKLPRTFRRNKKPRPRDQGCGGRWRKPPWSPRGEGMTIEPTAGAQVIFDNH
jgi:hypothetical protein